MDDSPKRMSAALVHVIKVSGKAMAPLQVKDLILQAIVAYDNISSMPSGHSKRMKGRMDTWIDLKCPVPATILWPFGTHWTQGAPLIAKRKNEGLPLTGDKLCWHVRKTPSSWKNVGDGDHKQFWKDLNI